MKLGLSVLEYLSVVFYLWFGVYKSVDTYLISGEALLVPDTYEAV